METSDETDHAMWFYSRDWGATFSLESVSHLPGRWRNIAGVGANFITNHVVSSTPTPNPVFPDPVTSEVPAFDKLIVSAGSLVTRPYVNTPKLKLLI